MSIDLPLDDPPAGRILAPALAPHAVRLDALARLPLSDEIEADVGLHQAGRIRPVDGGDLELGDAHSADLEEQPREVGDERGALDGPRLRRDAFDRDRAGLAYRVEQRLSAGVGRQERVHGGSARALPACLAERPQLRFDRRGDRLGGERVVAGLELRRERLEELGRLQRRSIDSAGRRLGRDANRDRQESGDGKEPDAPARHRAPVPVSSSVCRRSTGRSCHDQRAPPGIRTSTDTGPAASPSPNSGRRSDCDR